MLNKIIEFSIKNKLIIGIATLILIIYGAFELKKLPIDAVPDITNNQVQVITIAPSYGATDIERLVTFPVEQANSNIAGLKEIRSYSRFGLSLVTIVFDDNIDIYWARQQVAERLQLVQSEIPNGIGTPSMGPISTGLGEIYQYVVRPKKGYEHKYTTTELRTIQDWIVRRQLLGVKGVAEVSSFGGKLKQYEVAIDANKLQSYGITIKDVFNALEANNENTGGAYIERNEGVLYIRTEGLLTNAVDIENIAIKSTQLATPLLIRNVAEVKTGHATRYGALTYNAEGEVSGAIVMMLKGGNSNVVVKNIKTKIEEIQKSLPEGVIIEPFLDRTKMVDNAISTVKTNLLEGALIVVFVLVIFLGNLRAGFLVASVIPLSMLFAVIMMNIFGVSGNLMSLGALDFGLMVDGAVIIVEAVMHQLVVSGKYPGLKRLTKDQMDVEVKSASGKMMNSAVFGQIIILIVYLPILTLEGIEGKMFKPMAQTVAFALIGAFILSLTYIPMMSALVLSRNTEHKRNFSDRMMDTVSGAYQRALKHVLQIPQLVIGSTIVLFLISFFVLSRMGGEFIPSIEEGDYAVETRVLAGSNLNTTIENTQKVVHILKSRFPEIEKVITKIGSSEIPVEPLPMDMGDMIITLKPKKEWTSAKTFDELSEKMTEAAKEIPGVTTSFQFPVQMRFNELMTGARQDVVAKIFGENLDTLSMYAKKLAEIVGTVKGAAELYVETISGIPQIVIEYDRPAIAQYGLSIEALNNVVNTAFAGQSAGLVFEGEKRFDVVVRLDNQNRKDLRDVQNLLIPTPSGQHIPLNQLASVALKDSPNQIQREDARRRILVGFNVKDRDVATIVDELRTKVDSQLKLPVGYSVTYGGAFENLNAAKDRLMIAVPVSLALIFLLLFFAFKSIKQGLLIYTAIPLSAIGGILFLAVRGMPFSISAGVGFIALFGIAVLNGIVLVAEFNRLKMKQTLSLTEIVMEGTRTRLRPVLMTAFVASLGFLPMAISSGAGGEVQRPLATVVIGGLMVATLLTLFVLPILYVQFEKGIKIKARAVTAVALAVLSFSTPASAQNGMDLPTAIDSALQNNLHLKQEKLKEQYRKQLISTAADISQIKIDAEYGKFNSNYLDNRISIAQDLNFPTVYKRQKEVYEQEWQQSVLQTNLQEALLIKQLSEVYFKYNDLVRKELLLNKTKENFTEFLRVAALRLQAGESTILEKINASNQHSQLQLQINTLLQDKTTVGMQFNLLINTKAQFLPQTDNNNYTQELPGQLQLNHPELQIFAKEKTINEAQIRLEKSKLLPDLNIGLNNTTLIDGAMYTGSNRFQSLQAGISIPLFSKAQKSRISAAKITAQISQINYEKEFQNFELKYNETLEKYRLSLANVEYFVSKGKKDADALHEALSQQIQAGEINYLEWSLLTQQAIQIEMAYLDAINQLNLNKIALEYFQYRKKHHEN